MALRGRFTFAPDQHIYRVGRYQVPGTTEIMRVAGRVDERYYTLTGRTRGQVIHELSEGLDLGLLDLTKLNRKVRGWVLAYAAFVEQMHPRHDLIEAAVVQRGYGFATMVDRAGYLLGRAVWNIKTGPMHPSHAIQRAAEKLALDGRWSARRRFTL